MSEERMPSVADAAPITAVVKLNSMRQVEGTFSVLSSPQSDMSLKVHIDAASHEIGDEELSVRVPFTLAIDSESGDAILKANAVYQLTYSFPDKSEHDIEAVVAFSNTNAVFNAWPYWREFVSSTVGRAAFPPLAVPLLRIEGGQITMNT